MVGQNGIEFYFEKHRGCLHLFLCFYFDLQFGEREKFEFDA